MTNCWTMLLPTDTVIWKVVAMFPPSLIDMW